MGEHRTGDRLIRIALVTHDLSVSGGAATMTRFLHGVLKAQTRYDVQVISLATSASDPASLLFRRPGTWIRGPIAVRRSCDGLEYLHVGAIGAEVEVQRYRPRRVVTDVLRKYDLILYSLGIPAWAATAEGSGVPFGLWIASTVRDDRISRLRTETGWRKKAKTAMTTLAEQTERRVLRSAQFVLTISEYTKGLLNNFQTRREPVVAPCGIDTELFKPDLRHKTGYLLSVGRFSDPRKNVRMLLEAYRILRERCADVPDLWLVGAPPSDELMNEVEGWGIRQHVVTLGQRRGHELAEIYRSAGCFALSSDQEGLAIVILEAMASGLPVVTTRCGGPEMLVSEGETGFFSDVNNANEFAQHLEYFVKDCTMQKQFGLRARAIAERHYSLTAASTPFLDAIHECLPS